MRRQKLVKVEIQDRYIFRARFERYIITSGINGIGQQLLFRDLVTEYGVYFGDNIRFNNLLQLHRLNLQPGDLITFHARIVICQNAEDSMFGFYNPQYGTYTRLMNPTKITKLIRPVKRLDYIVPYELQIIPYEKINGITLY